MRSRTSFVAAWYLAPRPNVRTGASFLQGKIVRSRRIGKEGLQLEVFFLSGETCRSCGCGSGTHRRTEGRPVLGRRFQRRWCSGTLP